MKINIIAVALCVLMCGCSSGVVEKKKYTGPKKYIVTIGLKQSRISINPLSHIKDAMDATEFEIPVDKDFYASVREGDELEDSFRAGAIILRRSLGSWRVWVKSKRTIGGN